MAPTLLVEEMDMSQNQPPMPPQGYYQQQPPQPPKKKHTARNVVGIVVAVIVLIMVVRCSAGGSGSSGGSTAEASAGSSAASAASTASTAAGRASGTGGDGGGKTVTMTASATGAGTVIWGTAGSTSTEQFTGSWTKEVQAEAADTYTLSVTGDAIYGDDSQEMGCTISVDGEQKQANSATGKMGSASCTVIVGLG